MDCSIIVAFSAVITCIMFMHMYVHVLPVYVGIRLILPIFIPTETAIPLVFCDVVGEEEVETEESMKGSRKNRHEADKAVS